MRSHRSNILLEFMKWNVLLWSWWSVGQSRVIRTEEYGQETDARVLRVWHNLRDDSQCLPGVIAAQSTIYDVESTLIRV
jgi:hypothetical protein